MGANASEAAAGDVGLGEKGGGVGGAGQSSSFPASGLARERGLLLFSGNRGRASDAEKGSSCPILFPFSHCRINEKGEIYRSGKESSPLSPWKIFHDTRARRGDVCDVLLTCYD
jgi:hypothetical protein